MLKYNILIIDDISNTIRYYVSKCRQTGAWRSRRVFHDQTRRTELEESTFEMLPSVSLIFFIL
jgi:hypothetical protein